MAQAIPFIIMGALTAAKTIGSARGEQVAANLERQQFELKAEEAQLRADADNNERRRLLSRTIGTQRAISAVSGTNVLGGSAGALEQESRRIAARDIRARSLTGQLEKSQALLGAELARQRGKMAKRTALISIFDIGAATFLQGQQAGAFGSPTTSGRTATQKTTGSSTRTKPR